MLRLVLLYALLSCSLIKISACLYNSKMHSDAFFISLINMSVCSLRCLKYLECSEQRVNGLAVEVLFRVAGEKQTTSHTVLAVYTDQRSQMLEPY